MTTPASFRVMRLPLPVRGCFSLAFVVLIAPSLGCTSSRDTPPPPLHGPVSGSPSLPPGTCRVAATIIQIVPPDPAETGPCGTIPCVALVRVDSVLGYGAAFPTPLSPGGTISVRFRYTLQPAKGLFPSTAMLPSPLGQGDTFVAVVEGNDVPGRDGQTPTTFSVGTYDKK